MCGRWLHPTEADRDGDHEQTFTVHQVHLPHQPLGRSSASSRWLQKFCILRLLAEVRPSG